MYMLEKKKYTDRANGADNTYENED